MPYDPNIHHRRSIRLKGYDYSLSGYYFITLYVKNGLSLFGEIIDHQMILNDAGRMVEKWYAELAHKFPDIECGEYMVMPNHFHCILFNNGHGNAKMQNSAGIVHISNAHAVRANLCVCPLPANLCVCPPPANLCVCPLPPNKNSPQEKEKEEILGEHPGSPLRSVIQWYKTMSTNEYIRGVKTLGWKRFDGKLWHINYWEHIIRTQHSFDAIAAYILHNPQNWDTDQLKDR